MYSSDEHGNLIARLWYGDVALWKTYWLLGVPFGLFWLAVTTAPVIGLAPEFPDQTLIIDVFIRIATISFAVFTFVAVWRSANNYAGQHNWGRVVRILVVASAILVTAKQMEALLSLTHQKTPPPTHQETPSLTYQKTSLSPVDKDANQPEIAAMNAELPSMVDEITRLDRVSVEGAAVVFSYTIIHDLTAFKLTDKTHLLPHSVFVEACQIRLDLGYAIARLEYVDNWGDHITQLTATNEACSGL